MSRLRLLLMLAALLSCWEINASDRIQFASQAPASSPYTGAPAATATPSAPPPTYAAPAANPYTGGVPIGGSYTGGTTTGATPYTGAVPGNTISGTFGTTGPTQATAPWDPYAPKASTPILPAPPALPYNTAPAPPQQIFTPNPGYLSNTPPQQGAYGGFIQPNGTIAQPQQLRQRIWFEGTWLAGDSSGTQLGQTDLELNGTFFFPMFGGRVPFFITPGFAVHYWNGPNSDDFTSVPPPQLPPRTYDAYLDGAIKPVINNWLSADLGARVGLYTDFVSVETNAIRVIARGIGIITISPTTQVVLGVVYLDRLTVKLLPVFGLIWVPNPDARFDIVFPQPKLSYRMTTYGTTEWWWYLGGEFGGGTWHFQREDGQDDAFQDNDLRLILGLEWKNQARPGLTGYFEVGYVFNREIEYIGVNPGFDPDDTVMLRAGVTF